MTEEVKTRVIAFRVTDAEFELLCAVARQDKQHVLEWVRTTALGVAEVQFSDDTYETK